MSLKIAVFYGSVRSARQGIMAARFIVSQCRERGHEVELIDPQEHEVQKAFDDDGKPDDDAMMAAREKPCERSECDTKNLTT